MLGLEVEIRLVYEDASAPTTRHLTRDPGLREPRERRVDGGDPQPELCGGSPSRQHEPATSQFVHS